jgi:pimeloyl-ACP methyl ester carboxylesterase
VVLLHHATASSRTWRRQAPLLAQHFHVLAYDRAGFGRSDWLESWGLDYLTQDVVDLIALLDALDLVHVGMVGHSDGATIALLAAARYPERVCCVVAEAPHVFVETSTCPAAVARFRDEALASPQLQAALTRDHGPRGGQVLQRWAERWTDPEFTSWDVSHELAAVLCPVLVIHGADDAYFPTAHAELIAAALAGSRLWLLPGVGHMPHAEVSAEFNRQVLQFLQQHLPSC